MKKGKRVLIFNLFILLCACIGMIFIGMGYGNVAIIATICLASLSMLCNLYLIVYNIKERLKEK